MTDKELLELAAKAAGLELDEVHLAYLENEQTFIRHEPDSDGISGEWNPLTDDGDALRLAVNLRMKVDFNKTRVYAQVPNVTNLIDKYNNDKFKAARQAITECAAEIGKGM